MPKSHKYPIRDVQFHEAGLREVAHHVMTKEEAIAVAWHTTALAYLKFGAFKGFNGPAAEIEVDGRVKAVEIEDYLVPAVDAHGLTYFQHVPRKNEQ